MKNKFVLKFGFVIICICVYLFQNKAFSQEKVLLVLDIQNFQNIPATMDSSVTEMIKNVNTLINNFNSENVIYVKSAATALSISAKGFSIDTIPPPEFDSSLIIVSNNVFVKTKGDAFSSQGLVNFLKSRKAKEIVLVGLMADKCIYQTALGGIEKKYDIIVVSEGIIGTTLKKKEKSLRKMKDKGIKSLSIQAVIQSL